MINILLVGILGYFFINGFMKKYTMINASMITMLSAILMCGYIKTILMLMMFCINLFFVNYDFVVKSYNVGKKTLNNMIQLSELESTMANSSPNVKTSCQTSSNEEIDVLKSIKSKIIWCEKQYLNISTICENIKTTTNNQITDFFEKYKNSTLKIDVDILCEFVINSLTFCKSICCEFYNILVEFAIIDKCANTLKQYYDTSMKVYNFENLETTEDTKDISKTDVLDKLDEMNNLFDMMIPAFKNIDTQFQPNFTMQNVNNIMPTDKEMKELNEMMTIFQNMGKITQCEPNKKILLKKKKKKV